MEIIPSHIYVPRKFLEDIDVNKETDSHIEYVRKDIFIEKACQWLYDNLH